MTTKQIDSNSPRAPRNAAQDTAVNPMTVEVTRGTMVESRHRAAFAVTDSGGRMVLQAGDIERPIYARSAIKPLQALALLESGAAEAYGLGDAEIALACASHNAESRHVETVHTWLQRIGCTVDDLECGPQMPARDDDMLALIRSGQEPTAAHNNCSGKHTGFLSIARHLGQPTKGYIDYGHPVQQRILGILEGMSGLDLSDAPRGIDGCGIPVIGMPLGNLALAMARLGTPSDQPDARQAACMRICDAMAAEPFMVAGSERFCTQVMQVTGRKALIKTGAEGVYCGTLPEHGLGIALKVDDGAGRAANVLMGRLLQRLEVLGEDDMAALSEVLTPPVLNRANLEVGEIRAASPSLTPGPF